MKRTALYAAGLTLPLAGGMALASLWSQPRPMDEPVTVEDCPCVIVTPDEVTWEAGPPSLPEGVEIAKLEGEPGEPGPFVARLRLPANTELRPHFHPAHERVTVISGTFHIGYGTQFDRDNTKPLERGSYAMIPPREPHFAWVEDETVLQLNGTGPWELIYVNPEDHPGR